MTAILSGATFPGSAGGTISSSGSEGGGGSGAGVVGATGLPSVPSPQPAPARSRATRDQRIPLMGVRNRSAGATGRRGWDSKDLAKSLKYWN